MPESLENNQSLLLWFFIPYFIIQLFLPARHWLIPHDVLWTEEGHRLSWRMMLRSRTAITHFRIIDTETQTLIPYDLRDKIILKQQNLANDATYSQ